MKISYKQLGRSKIVAVYIDGVLAGRICPEYQNEKTANEGNFAGLTGYYYQIKGGKHRGETFPTLDSVKKDLEE